MASPRTIRNLRGAYESRILGMADAAATLLRDGRYQRMKPPQRFQAVLDDVMRRFGVADTEWAAVRSAVASELSRRSAAVRGKKARDVRRRPLRAPRAAKGGQLPLGVPPTRVARRRDH